MGIWVELPLYAIKARRWGMVCQCLTMEALYFALVVALCYLNTAATVWTLAVPLVITSFALMLGNWYAAPGQLMPLHAAMIDPDVLLLQLTYRCTPCAYYLHAGS